MSFRPSTLPAYLTQPPPSPPQRHTWDAPPPRSVHKKPSGSGDGLILWLLLGWFGGLTLLAVTAGVGYIVYVAGGLGRAEMSIAGYRAQAPGRLARENSSMSSEEVGILNPRTGSQFQLIYIRSVGRTNVTPDVFIEGLRRNAGDVIATTTTRLGMNGIHFEARRAINGADAEGEVFAISGGALVVLYQSGSSLADRKGRDVKYTGDRERNLDKVDQFFASLTKVE